MRPGVFAKLNVMDPDPSTTRLIGVVSAWLVAIQIRTLAATGITALRTDFEPLVPGGSHVPNTNSYHWPADRHPLWAAELIEARLI